MRRCLVILTVAVCLLTTGSASARTEFGNDCTGDATAPDWTAIALENGKPFIDPFLQATAGPYELWGAPHAVITRWKTRLASGLGPLAQRLVAFKPMEGGLENVGESNVETLVDGMNEFATRIPLPEYARVGLRGPTATLYCDAVPNSFLGVVEGSFPPGQIRSPSSQFDKGAPVVAVIEGDRDGDGYGDVTQDKCPNSARFHDSCPSVELTGWVEAIRRGAIVIGVTVNVDTRVDASGEVSWPIRPKPKRGVRPSKAARKRVFVFPGGSQEVAAGTVAVYTLPLPRGVIRRLDRTPRSERLDAWVRLFRPASDQAGLSGIVTRVLKVKLPGRERRPAKQ